MTGESERAGTTRPKVGASVARFLSARVDRHSAVGLRLTLGIIVAALAVWGFSGLLEEVLDNESLVRWDMQVNAWLHGHATSAGLAIFNVITSLGSVGVWLTVAVGCIWLWRGGHRLLFTAWLGTNVGGVLLQMALKRFIHRARPEYAGDYLHGHSYSFPSGHAMQSTIAYVMIVFVAMAANPQWRPRRGMLFGAAAALVLLISFSRLYLGVHYPSDVLGGIAAGTAWLAATLVLLGIADDRRTRRSAGDHGTPSLS